MIATALITALLTMLAVKGRHPGAALTFGVSTIALLAVLAPGFVTGLGKTVAHIAAGVGDGIAQAVHQDPDGQHPEGHH